MAAASPPAPLPGPLPPSFVCPFNYENYVGHFYILKTAETCQVGLKCPGTMILTLAGHSMSVTTTQLWAASHTMRMLCNEIIQKLEAFVRDGRSK